MLRTNLASRPFYNDRLVRIGIGVGIVVVAALSAFDVAEILTLNARNRDLGARAAAAESRAAALRDQARETSQTLRSDDVTLMQGAARQANLLIERRAFSWTDLFNRFEETLPEDVRVAAVQPQVDTQGRMLIVATVFSRRVEDLQEFIERLEATGIFHGVLSRQDDLEQDGTLRSVIQGYYTPPVVETAPASAASDPSGGAPVNTTPAAPPAGGGQ